MNKPLIVDIADAPVVVDLPVEPDNSTATNPVTVPPEIG
jgi:hypothetical protein